jgi:hypothetical protein
MAETAELIYVIHGKDADGFPVDTEQTITVFVREKSVKRTEFYESMRSGIVPQIVFEVRQEDYDLTAHLTDAGKRAYASKIRYDGAVYDIVRAYRNDRSMIELTCS